MLAVLALALGLASPAEAQPANSGFFNGTPAQLLAANGGVVNLGGSGCSLSNLVLTCTGGSSGPFATQYEVQTPGGAPLTTTPYYLTTYAERAGTINYARVAFLAASGGNFQYVVHVVHGGTDTVVGGLNNNGVCDGEPGCGSGQLATYASPNVMQATSANTYAVGDMIYVSFNTVGGTFTDVSFHLSVTM